MFKKFVMAAVCLSFTSLFVLAGCSSDDDGGGGGGGYSCTDKGSCPNDVAPTQDEVNQCQQAMADAKCGAKYKALGDCAKAHASCGADGKTTTDSAQCQQAAMDYLQCTMGGGG